MTRQRAPESAPRQTGLGSSDRSQDTSEALTWADLVAAEPRLADLETQARLAHQMPGPRCTNAIWYGRYNTPSMKTDYSRLVGWGRPRSAPGPEWLRSCEAFELGYQYLYDLLPCDVGPDGCRCESW
jgi:hypothetical protein